jgi:hypothetical protein
MLFQRPIEFPTAIARKSLTSWSHLMDHRKPRELSSKTVFGTSRVLANPSLEIEDPFRRCSVQKQNIAVTSIVKLLYLLNHLVDRVV